MNTKLIKINHLLIGILIILQPVINMFQTIVVRDVQLFGISVFEAFNILAVIISVYLSIYTYPNKKAFIKFLPYVLALGIYVLLHGYNIYQFNGNVYSLQEPNFIVESYYIFRTFIVPLLLIFTIFYSGMKKEQIIKILEIFVFVVVSVMVITNILKIAQRNYAEETIYNTLNLFDWFSFENVSRRSYYQLTTRGWFLSGNQMSAILFMTLPVMVYRAYKVRDIFHYLLIALQMLAMFMLGTKVANLGSLLVVLLFVVCWAVFKIFKHKEKGIIVLLVMCIGFAVLFPFSPVGYMLRYDKQTGTTSSSSGGVMLDSALEYEAEDEHQMNEEQRQYYENLKKDSKRFKQLDADSLTEEEKIFVREYMTEYCGYFGISTFIIDNYNDLEHSVFWTHYIQETPSNDYRVLKTMILKDIYDKNNNPLDKYFGMGYTLNYIYTEMDYSYQYYYYGVIGMIMFIAPYFYMLFYVVIQGLRHFKAMFTLECAMYAIAPLLGLCVAKLSGHVLERQLPLLVIGMVMSILLIHTRNVNENSRMQN